MSHLELCLPPSTILCKLISCGSLYLSLNYRIFRQQWLRHRCGQGDLLIQLFMSLKGLSPIGWASSLHLSRLLSPATWPYSLYRTSVTNRKQLAQWGRGSRDKGSLSLLTHTAHRQGYSLTQTEIDWDGARIQLSLQARLPSISRDKKSSARASGVRLFPNQSISCHYEATQMVVLTQKNQSAPSLR